MPWPISPTVKKLQWSFDSVSGEQKKESAGKLLAREIHTNEPLMAELSKTAYSPQRKLLSPKQIQIIFSFLGEP